MSTSEASFQSQRPQRPVVAAALVVLALAAGSYGIRSRLALAAPESASSSEATMSMTQQSVQPRAASANADFGPGQCEPCLVSLQ
jgi:predicted metal-binding membrane protein